MQLRWHFNSAGPKVDFVASADATSKAGHTLSGRSFAKSIGDTLIASGEIAQRLVENPKRLNEGPAGLLNVTTFDPASEPTSVWSAGDVEVMAINSRHIPGHASYRVNTPAGSVVIGGDAGNDKPAPPRSSSTSMQVETLAADADIIVHSTIHPVMGPDHLIPPLNAAKQGPYPIPGGALQEQDYLDAVSKSGFEGSTIVGQDLVSLTLPSQ